MIELQVTTTDPGSDNKLIGREDRLALSRHRGRGGFLAGGPMECGPRDLQVWALALLYFIVFASLPHQKRKIAMTTTKHGCGPMECRPRDLVKVWAAEPSKARQARDGPNQRKRLSGGHNSQFTTQGG